MKVGWIRWDDGSPELRLKHPVCAAEHNCGERAAYIVAIMDTGDAGDEELEPWDGKVIYGACTTVVETMALDLGITVELGSLA